MDFLIKLSLIPIGIMLIWTSKWSARHLVLTGGIAPWFEPISRVLYIVFGVIAVVAGLKLLIWG